jgi:hypothetical protein
MQVHHGQSIAIDIARARDIEMSICIARARARSAG